MQGAPTAPYGRDAPAPWQPAHLRPGWSAPVRGSWPGTPASASAPSTTAFVSLELHVSARDKGGIKCSQRVTSGTVFRGYSLPMCCPWPYRLTHGRHVHDEDGWQADQADEGQQHCKAHQQPLPHLQDMQPRNVERDHDTADQPTVCDAVNSACKRLSAGFAYIIR